MENDNETKEKKIANTEYLPTKCRITKPPPPKPATNPLQFVKVAPCPLFQKAQEQIKKVEEIKKERKEVRDEAEDWQQNLDNWKSSRRKRQEHIIERVVEVKKLEQEQEKGRRKSKTFSEMIEERSRGRHKFNIPIYDDDSNDLSDYGIGSSSSKTNSIKDVDTDDSCSILDDREQNFDYLSSNKDNSSASNQSQSEDENVKDKIKIEKTNEYTYEGAIEDYRTRIRSRILVDESIFNRNDDKTKSKEFSEAQNAIPKGEIFKRKELFEVDKQIEITPYENSLSRRLSEDFANTQSIKQRLESLEKCTESTKSGDKNSVQTSLVKQRLHSFNKINEDDTNNNLDKPKIENNNKIEWRKDDRCSSPETEMYMNKLNMFNRDLDNLMYGKSGSNLYDYSNYPPSTSSTDITDKEDSGIHTADVSCSVSQADEPVEDSELITAEKVVEKPLKFEEIIDQTRKFLESLKLDSSNNQDIIQTKPVEKLDSLLFQTPVELIPNDIVIDSNFPLGPSTLIEPPKVKPPPPPPADDSELKRMNSTKRIKKEIHIKRSSFLGLEEPIVGQLYSEISIGKPPDVNTFLQNESKMEKTLYKKMQEENRLGNLSKVESQDSGLDIERSSDWCSSGDNSTPTHGRQDSEQTNSITSEEDEIMKKEREIIEMVEKEEKTLKDNRFPSKEIQEFVDTRDSEAVKVETELLQLEREELERQRENLLYQKNKRRLQANRHSLENICDEIYTNPDYRKSMPELQHIPLEYRKSLPDVPNAYIKSDVQYRKSMPDIQRAYNKFVAGEIPPEHRKSLPELQIDTSEQSAFKQVRQPIMPGKAIRPMPKPGNKPRPLSRHSLQALSAVPKSRPNNNWIQPKANPEVKNYNQHWLFQEAELRRISDQQQKFANKNWNQPKEKHLPDSIIQSLTQRVQNRVVNPPISRRSDASPEKNYDQYNSYMGHNQTMGHALPMPYLPPAFAEESQDRILSVSGKKKCSYCSNELGRGAAMIIESLCLFYHMECFKCCVCHVQLGDGMMGTDVRVRNQKLHCHNCYSSDDGVKFSCV